uniref:Peptidase aspartic putative domain-containing protein n=1 Tax=Panagrolaimus davidi TaxID=227884 RepID=A0A914PYG7_9BILA
MNLQKYNGDYLGWNAFWQRFDLNIHSQPYSKIEKLDALFGLLEGKAMDEVRGFIVSEENYDTVIQILTERFGNKLFILNKVQCELQAISAAAENYNSIRDTVTSITNLCRQLQNFGVDISYDHSLQLNIIDKMPLRVKEELTYFSLTTSNVSTDMILKKMKDYEIKAEIALQVKTRSNIEPSNCNNKVVCILCEDNHSTDICPKFPSVDGKIQQLELKKRCTKCARRYHYADQCRSTIQCDKCHGQHYTYLCKSKPKIIAETSDTLNAFISIGKQQGCLLGKKIQVMNPETRKTVDATVLFDAGSQRSFVSEKVIRQLKLPRGAYEKLNLQGIGAKATNYTSSSVKLCFKTTEGFENITAYSIKQIARSIQLPVFEENDPMNYKVIESTPDILLGLDYFFHFITSFEKRNNVVIIYSKIGQMLSGIQTTQNDIYSALAIEPKTLSSEQKKFKCATKCQHKTKQLLKNQIQHCQITAKFKQKTYYNSAFSRKWISTKNPIPDKEKCHGHSAELHSTHRKILHALPNINPETTTPFSKNSATISNVGIPRQLKTKKLTLSSAGGEGLVEPKPRKLQSETLTFTKTELRSKESGTDHIPNIQYGFGKSSYVTQIDPGGNKYWRRGMSRQS